MATWNDVRDGARRAANKVVKKTGEVADTASLYVKLKAAESKLNAKFTVLGKLTYKQLESGESQAAEIAPVLDSIRVLKDKIRNLQTQIELDKEKRKKTETEVKIEEAVADINEANDGQA